MRGIFMGKATEDTCVLIGKVSDLQVFRIRWNLRYFDNFLYWYLQVNQSQRLSDAPLKPWLVVKRNGTVLTAHCNCMAGLGEVCLHVGAILFAVEASVRLQKAKTCTSVPCQWILTSSVSNVPYAELQNINFTASSTKKRKVDEIYNPQQHTPQNSSPKPRTAYSPSPAQIHNFYKKLHDSRTKPVILSLVSNYNKEYIPKTPETDLPNILDDLYSEELRTAPFSDLLTKANEVFRNISCSKVQKENVEKSTWEQRNAEIRSKMRTGRIAASVFHQASRTNPADPSVSLIKQICYGNTF